MRKAALAPVLILAAGCAGPGQLPTPQRPSFSSDTSTTAPGTLEIEGGVSLVEGGGADTPMVLKWGSGRSTEHFVGWSPWLRASDDGPDGSGDVVVGTRHRFHDGGPGPAGAVQLAAKLPAADADEGLGSGETDVFAAAIATGGVGGAAVVGFYQLGFLGAPGSGTDAQHALAGAAAWSLTGNLSGFLELTGIVTPAADTESAFLTAGAGLSVGRTAVLDGAIAVGLTDDVPDYSLAVGATVNLGARH